MIKVNLPKFKIHLDRLNSDLDKVSALMERFESDRRSVNQHIVGKSLPAQTKFLQKFSIDLRTFIDRLANEQGRDVFGNEYKKWRDYDRIEVSIPPTYEVITFRLIGDIEKPAEEQIRYAIFCKKNELDPTTLNIVSDIRNIADKISGFSDVGPYQKCADVEFTPNRGISSAITWTDFVNTFFWPTPQIVNTSIPLTPADIKSFSQRFDQNTAKTREQLKNEDDQISSYRTKLNLKKNREGGYELNDASSYTLLNTDKIKSDLRSQIGNSVNVIMSAYTQIYDKFSLCCLIQGAIDCIMPPLSCREIIEGIPYTTVIDYLISTYDIDEFSAKNPKEFGGSIAQSIVFVIDSTFGENTTKNFLLGNRDNAVFVDTATDVFYDALEQFVDLESICSFLRGVACGEKPEPFVFEWPDELPIIDLYGGITTEMDNAILEALVEAIVNLILGILSDLDSCDTLDALSAAVLQGEFGPATDVVTDMLSIVPGISTVDNPERGTIGNRLGSRLDNFKDEMNQTLNSGIRVKGRQGASLGDQVGVNLDPSVGTTFQDLADVQNAILQGAADPEDFSKAFTFKLGNELIISENVPDVVRGEIPNNGTIPEGVRGVFGNAKSFENYIRDTISKLGRFEDSEEDSFTLGNITDEEIRAILEYTNLEGLEEDTCSSISDIVQSLANQQEELEEEGQNEGIDFSEALEDLLDEAVALLTPGEFIQLIAGEPTETVTKIIKEIVNSRHPEMLIAGDPLSIFETMGRLTGLNTIRDRLLVLSDGANKNVVNQYCATKQEWQELENVRNSILRGDPRIGEDSITRIIETRKTRVQDYFKILSSGPDITPEEFIECVKCGTGFQQNGTRPPVIDAQLDATLNLMFEGAKMAFDREVGKFATTIDRTVDSIEKIPTTIDLQNAGSVTTFVTGADGELMVNRNSSISGILSEAASQDFDFDSIKNQKVINPEFKVMVDGGYVPRKADGEEIGTPDDEAGPYTNAGTVNKTVTRRVPAGLFKQAMTSLGKDSFSLQEGDASSSIFISNEGVLETNSKFSVPNFNLEYVETKDSYNLKVGTTYSATGTKANYNYFRKTSEIPEDVKNFIDELSSGTGDITRRSAMSSFILKKLNGALESSDSTEIDENSLIGQIELEYDEIAKSLFSSLKKSARENRLIQKIDDDNNNPNQRMVLDLFNFSSMQTTEQRLCKADPHLLDIDFVKRLVKDTFDKECESQDDPLDGTTIFRKPINSAGFVGLVLTIIRLYVIEYVFRSLFIYDELGYSLSLADDEVLIDYITFRMVQDIKDIGNQYGTQAANDGKPKPNLWGRFREEAIIAFDKMVLSKNIKIDEDREIKVNDGSVGVFTEGSVIGGETGLPEQLKILVKQTMRSVLAKFSKLIEVEPKSNRTSERTYLDTLPLLDTYSEFQDSTYTSNDNRFSDDSEEEEQGRFILERYVRVANQQEDEPYLKNVVNLTNWREYISGFNQADIPISGSRVGIRLVYVSPSFEGRDKKNKFKIGNDFVDLNLDEINQEKAYYIRDYRDSKKEEREVGVLNSAAAEQIDIREEKQFNTVILSCAEIQIDSDFTEIESGDLSNLFEESSFIKLFQERLLTKLSKNEDYLAFYKYMMPVQRYQSLLAISNTFLMRTENIQQNNNIDNLFDGTKKELFDLFDRMTGLGDYNYDPSLGAAQNAAQFQEQFMNMGNPSGPSSPDAFMMWLMTPEPIVELVGAILSGPSGIITLLYIKLAAAGYFNPAQWFAEGEVPIADFDASINDPVKYRISEDTLVFNERVLALDSEFVIVNGRLCVKREATVTSVTQPPPETDFFGNQVATSSTVITETRLANSPAEYKQFLSGEPIPQYTNVYEVETEANGDVTVDQDGNPVLKTNPDGTFVIRWGPGAKGIPAPGPKDRKDPWEGIAEIAQELTKNAVNQASELGYDVATKAPSITASTVGGFIQNSAVQNVLEASGMNEFVKKGGGLPNLDQSKWVEENYPDWLKPPSKRADEEEITLTPSVRVWPGEPQYLSYFETYSQIQNFIYFSLFVGNIGFSLLLGPLLIILAPFLALFSPYIIYASAWVVLPTGYGWSAMMDALKGRMPYYQNRFAQSAVSRKVKREFGVNPAGASENFVCKDNENSQDQG